MTKSAKDQTVYLRHIADCLARITEYTQEGREAFLADLKTQDAVARNLQTMAESTQHLSAARKASHPAINWRAISGFRNVLAHDNLDVDWEQVWEIVTSDLPTLEQEVAAMLQELS